MSSGNEVTHNALPWIRAYKDGRVERFIGTEFVPPSLDPTTRVTSKDVVIHPDTNLSARLYLPDLNSVAPGHKIPVLVYYHGGGFYMESPFSTTYHPYLNSLASRANVLAVSVNYRLAPEHPIPAAYDDSWVALQWVASGGDEWLVEHGDMERLFVAGDSVGANISHHMALRVGESGLVPGATLEGVALVHPCFWGTRRMGTEGEDKGALLKPAELDALWAFVCPGAAVGEEDPRLNPLAEGAPSLAGLGCRRLLVAVAERDTLRERGVAYYEGVKGSGWGGEVEMFESEGKDHVFHLLMPGCEKGLEMMERMVSFVNR